VILFAVPCRFCLIAAIASWAFCFVQPENRAALHRAKALLNPDRPGPQNSMKSNRS